MIGARGVLSAAVSIALCGTLSGEGLAAASRAADRLVTERATAAEMMLRELEHSLEPALEAGRRGAARIVAGDAPPGEELRRSAATAIRAQREAAGARSALTRLAAALRARHPAATVVEPPVAAGELESIAGQLEATAEAGEEFAAMRRRSERVTASLAGALAALEDRDLDAAEAATMAARRDHDVIREWDVDLVTLPVWIETTDAMIGAMETILRATRAGDRTAAEEAADAFAALAEDADEADRALRIAASEGGSAVSAAALERLAAAVASVREAQAHVAAILQADGR